MHYGQDMAAPAGTPVNSMQAGRITRIDRHSDVTVTHADGSTKTYRHITPGGVREGQNVEAGGPLGRLRARDPRSTGPHLHLEATDAEGRRYDPRAEIEAAGRPRTEAATKDRPMEQRTPWTRVPADKPLEQLRPWAATGALPRPAPSVGTRVDYETDGGMYGGMLKGTKPPMSAKELESEAEVDRMMERVRKLEAENPITREELERQKQVERRDSFIETLKDRARRGEQFGQAEGETIRRKSPDQSTLSQVQGSLNALGQKYERLGPVKDERIARGVERAQKFGSGEFQPDRLLTLDEIRRKYAAPKKDGPRPTEGRVPVERASKRLQNREVPPPAGAAAPRRLRSADDPQAPSPRFAEPRRLETRRRPEMDAPGQRPGGGGSGAAGGGHVTQNFHGGFDAGEVARRSTLERNREIRRGHAGALHSLGRIS